MEICYFCDIASGKEQRMHIAFEDNAMVAVLVSEPVNPGQLVLVPKAHVATLDEMGEDGAAHLFEITRRLMRAIRNTEIKCEGTELHLSEGPTSSLPHVLMQLLPRFEGDRLWREAQRSWDISRRLGPRKLLWWEELVARQHDDVWLPKREASEEELREVATRIRKAYRSLWGGPSEALDLTRRS